MIEHDDIRFSSFARDLARRHRRPRQYPRPPVPVDALEQLCGGGTVVPPSCMSLDSEIDFGLEDEVDDQPS